MVRRISSMRRKHAERAQSQLTQQTPFQSSATGPGGTVWPPGKASQRLSAAPFTAHLALSDRHKSRRQHRSFCPPSSGQGVGRA
jgi:hypothetical protein